MKFSLRSRKLWLLVIPIALGLLIWLLLPAYVSYFSYHPEVDYRTILQTSPSYDLTENVSVSFSYEPVDSPNLTKLRETYKLDKIAGSGSDFEKAKNLLRWVHELIPHDGSSPLPAQRDAIALIDSAKNSGKGLNCRGLAIVLSEALLSVGVKARFVELLPKDFSTESHVVTLAYIPESERWVFFDPSYQAYLVDTAGDTLGLNEIRARLINGSTLLANAEINYNGGPLDVDYLNYLSKNLYRFASPEHSGFGIDTSPERRMIVLNPAGDSSGRSSPFQKQIILHNPALFWAKP
jgi:transglutaminase-like putative cysteine protease